MAVVNLSQRFSSSVIPPRAYFGNPRRRAGIGDGSSVNPTTIWTPSTGFLATPGNINTGTQPAVYQAPTPVPVPACSQDTEPGGAAFSAACIAQVLAAQQQNMNLANAANYNVDITNCNNAWAENDAQYAADGQPRPPNTCGSNTFGLTPTVSGGYTGSTTGPQPTGSPNPSMLEPTCPAGQTMVNGICQLLGYTAPTSNQPTVASTQPTSQTTQMILNSATQANAANGLTTSSSAAPAGITTTEILYAVGGLAALALLFVAIK